MSMWKITTLTKLSLFKLKNMKRKYLIIGSAVILCVSLMSFTSAKKKQIEEVLKKIIISPKIPKRIDFRDFDIKIVFDLKVQNPTSEHLQLSSLGTIKVSGFRLYKGDDLLTMGSLNNISAVDLPPISISEIKNIEVLLPIDKILGVFAQELTGKAGVGGIISALTNLTSREDRQSMLQKLKSIDAAKLVEDFVFEVDIIALGQTYTHKHRFI